MSNLTEQEAATFVGRNTDYYLRKWRPVLDGTGNAGNATGFNWAAFFLSGLWLPYRKMFRAASIFFGVILLETLLEDILYIGILGKPKAPGSLGIFVSLIAAITCGGFGNAWYLAHAKKKAAELRSQGLPEDAYLQALADRGGASVVVSIAFLIMAGIVAWVLTLLSGLLLKGF